MNSLKCSKGMPLINTGSWSKIWHLGAVLVSLSGASAAAEEALVFLDTQVVSATGQHMRVDDAVIKTEVITSQQLEFMQAKVLTDALQHAPGLKIQRTVKNGSKLNIQGADANHVLILKDGLPFISPTGSETDISQIPLAGIERIEIIKGAGSALYGSSAMGGVVNLISKESDGNSAELDVSMGYNSDHSDGNHQQGSLFFARKLADWKLGTQFFYKQTPEIDLDDESVYADAARQTLQSTELRLDRYGSSFNGFVRVNYLTDEKQKTMPQEFYPIDGQRYFDADYKTQTNKQSLDGGINKLSSALFDEGSLMARYEIYREQSGNRDALIGDKNQRKVTTELGKAEGQFSKYLGYMLADNINYGFAYQNNSMQQTKIGTGVEEISPKKTHTYEGFLQNSLILGDSNELIFGVRSQYDSDFEDHHSLKANWMYTENALKLRLSYGMGYRTPNLKERYYEFDHSNLGYIIKGSTGLVPETSDNLNLVASYIFDHATLDFSLFYNVFKDKLETQSAGSSGGVKNYQYTNIAEAFTRGGDISITWQPDQDLYWQNSLALMDSRDVQSGYRLENRPRWSFKTQLNAAISERLSISLYGIVEHDRFNGLYDSDRDEVLDSYKTSKTDTTSQWDIKASWKGNQHLKLYGAIENVFDQTLNPSFDQLAEADERTVEPRLFRLGLTLSY